MKKRDGEDERKNGIRDCEMSVFVPLGESSPTVLGYGYRLCHLDSGSWLGP